MFDPDRFIGLLDRHAAGLELYARQFCNQAEDVVQEAFVELAGQQAPPRNVAAWLYVAVRRKALTAARSSGRRRVHERAAAERTEAWFEPGIEDRLDAAVAEEALAELDMETREPIVLHLWGTLSFEEIAATLGVSSSTAHRRYLAGLERLREKLRIEIDSETIGNRT